MSIIFSGLISAIAVNKALNSMHKQIGANVKTPFSLQGGEEGIKKELAEKAARTEGIEKHNYLINSVVKTDRKIVDKRNSNVNVQGYVSEDGVRMLGIEDSSLYPAFFSRIYELTEVKPVKNGDAGSALIHEEFARLNNMKVGDSLTLQKNGKEVKLKVVGIYLGTAIKRGVMSADNVENNIFTDLRSAETLQGGKDTYMGQAWFFTKEVGQIEHKRRE